MKDDINERSPSKNLFWADPNKQKMLLKKVGIVDLGLVFDVISLLQIGMPETLN